jgi:hypothetical protein
MARNTAKFCLCTILLLLTIGCPFATAAEIGIAANVRIFANGRFQLDQIEELTTIPSAPARTSQQNSFRNMLSPPCRFIELYMRRNEGSAVAATTATTIRSACPTCPTEQRQRAEFEENIAFPVNDSNKVIGAATFQPSQWKNWTLVVQPLSKLNQFKDLVGRFSYNGIQAIQNGVFSYVASSISKGIEEVQELTSFTSGESVNVRTDSKVNVNSLRSPTNSAPSNDKEASDAEEPLDSYWEYYQDCDNWDVTFAYLTMQPSLPIGLLSNSDELELRTEFPFLLPQALATQNPLLLVAPGREAIKVICDEVAYQIKQSEFEFIESRQFPALEVDAAQALELTAIQADALSPAITIPILLVHSEWVHPGSVVRPATDFFDQYSGVLAKQLNPIAMRIKSIDQVENLKSARRKISTKKSFANSLRNLGQRLIDCSENLLDDVRISECELSSQTRLAERSESDRR